MVIAKKIGVDCIPNEKEEIKNGGPEFLGFDFYVGKDKTEETIDFIESKLNELDIPLIRTFIYDESYRFEEEHLWTPTRIEETIIGQRDLLINESNKRKGK